MVNKPETGSKGDLNYYDETLASPEATLARDEAFLASAEQNGTPSLIRFWESPPHIVVLP